MPYCLLATLSRLALECDILPAHAEASEYQGRHAPDVDVPFVLIEAHHADAPTRAVYDDIKTTLGLPFVNTDYRALARWPSHFARAWNDLRPVVETPAYRETVGTVHTDFVAAAQTGARGQVVGIDMTAEMLAKSRATASTMGLANVEFREGLLEDMPVADVMISNGVINLCVDKKQVLSEIMRVLRPGGVLQFADIANGKPVPAEAVNNIDLWTS